MGFFRPSLSTITSTAHAMLARSGGADVVVLVGGFSASRFVTRELTAALEKHGMPVVAPDYGATAVLGGRLSGYALSRKRSDSVATQHCLTNWTHRCVKSTARHRVTLHLLRQLAKHIRPTCEP